MLVFPCQPLSPSSQRRLKQLTDKHSSGKIYQVMGTVVGSRDLDLNLSKGELVAVISEADTRGDKRRWLVDAGGKNHRPAVKMALHQLSCTCTSALRKTAEVIQTWLKETAASHTGSSLITSCGEKKVPGASKLKGLI